MKKRALLVALAAAMAASLAGCGGSSASSTTAAGSAAEGSEAAGNTAADASGKDSLVIVTSSDVLSMDPYRYDEGPTNQKMCIRDRIEGLKAVPRAERHRLREIPEEEAYEQWRLRLAAEAIENAAERAAALYQQILEKNENREEWELEHWCETADAENKQFWSGDRKEPAEGEMAALTEQYETAQSAWKDACLFWYDIWCESCLLYTSFRKGTGRVKDRRRTGRRGLRPDACPDRLL